MEVFSNVDGSMKGVRSFHTMVKIEGALMMKDLRKLGLGNDESWFIRRKTERKYGIGSLRGIQKSHRIQKERVMCVSVTGRVSASEGSQDSCFY